jgi:uncharacterized protein YbjT (DUF2867 family)
VLARAAEQAGVPRYVMVSAIGVDQAPDGDDVFSVYLRAKRDADEALRQSDLHWAIVRPGGLTDDPATGRVSVGERLEHGPVPRDDVAAVLAAVLRDDLAGGRTFDLVGGETPIDEALRTL